MVDCRLKNISYTDNSLILDIIFNIDIPEKLELNLNTFLYTKLKVNLKLYKKKDIICKYSFERIIKYDKWDNKYLIIDSDKEFVRKNSSFSDLKEGINKIENIHLKLLKKIDEKELEKLSISCDYILKSTEFIPPMKILEFNKKFGNIRIKNIRCSLKTGF